MTTPLPSEEWEKELSKLNEFRLYRADGESVSIEFAKTLFRSLLTSEREKAREEERERLERALEALYYMYQQYCATSGHLFMTAGEHAMSVLEAEGRIVCDDAGILLKDFNHKEV